MSEKLEFTPEMPLDVNGNPIPVLAPDRSLSTAVADGSVVQVSRAKVVRLISPGSDAWVRFGNDPALVAGEGVGDSFLILQEVPEYFLFDGYQYIAYLRLTAGADLLNIGVML